MTNTPVGRREATPNAARGRFNRQLRYRSAHPLEPLARAPFQSMRLMWDHCATGLWVDSRPLNFEEVSAWVSATLWEDIQAWFNRMDRVQNNENLVGQAFFKCLLELDAQGVRLAQQLTRSFQGVSARGQSVQIDYWCESASLLGKSNPQVRVRYPRPLNEPFNEALRESSGSRSSPMRVRSKLADYFVADVIADIERYARNQGRDAVLKANTGR